MAAFGQKRASLIQPDTNDCRTYLLVVTCVVLATWQETAEQYSAPRAISQRPDNRGRNEDSGETAIRPQFSGDAHWIGEHLLGRPGLPVLMSDDNASKDNHYGWQDQEIF